MDRKFPVVIRQSRLWPSQVLCGFVVTEWKIWCKLHSVVDLWPDERSLDTQRLDQVQQKWNSTWLSKLNGGGIGTLLGGLCPQTNRSIKFRSQRWPTVYQSTETVQSTHWAPPDLRQFVQTSKWTTEQNVEVMNWVNCEDDTLSVFVKTQHSFLWTKLSFCLRIRERHPSARRRANRRGLGLDCVDCYMEASSRTSLSPQILCCSLYPQIEPTPKITT